MRAFTRQRSVRLFALALAGTLAGGCKSDGPTDATPVDLTIANGRNSSPGYASANLGALASDNQSRANGVNDAGEVVGYSCCSAGMRPFVTLGGWPADIPRIGGRSVGHSSRGQRRRRIGG